MTQDIHALIAAKLAEPITHKVLTTFDDGHVYTHESRSLEGANNWAVGERRKLGVRVKVRETGKWVSRVSVEVKAI